MGWQSCIFDGKMCTGWQNKKEYLKELHLLVQEKDFPIARGTYNSKL